MTKSKSSSSQKGPKETIINPITHRKIVKDGRTYKKLTKSTIKWASTPSWKVPKKFKHDLFQEMKSKGFSNVKAFVGTSTLKFMDDYLEISYPNQPTAPFRLTIRVMGISGGEPASAVFKSKTVNLPQNISDEDVNRYAYAYVTNKDLLVVNSGFQIIDIQTDYVRIDPTKQFHKLFMMGTKLTYKVFSDICNIKQNDGTCVIDYLMAKLPVVYPKLTRDALISSLERVGATIEDGITTENLVDLKHHFYPRVNIYALDPFFHPVVIDTINKTKQSCINLSFVNSNNHLYPIESEHQQHQLTYTKKIDLTDFKFNPEFTEDNFELFAPSEYKVKHGEDMVTVKHTMGKKPIQILADGFNIRDILEEVQKQTNHLIDVIDCDDKGNIKGFKHPVTKQYILEGPDFEERKQALNLINKDFNDDKFLFVNQSWASIGNSIFNQIVGTLPSSTYSQRARHICDSNFARPLSFQCYDEIHQNDDVVIDNHDDILTGDIRKCYSSVLLYNEERIPIFSFTDSFQPYTHPIDIGYYLVANTPLNKIKTPTGNLTLPGGVYSSYLINELLERKYIDGSTIKEAMTASNYIDGTVFKSFVEYIYSKFDHKIAKKILNPFTGLFNTLYHKEFKACVCEYDSAMALINECPESTKLCPVGDMFFVSRESRTRKINDKQSYYIHIISGGILKMINTIESMIDENSLVLALKTDCVSVYKPKPSAYKIFTSDTNTIADLGTIRREEQPPVCYRSMYEVLEEANDNIEETMKSYKPIQGKGIMFMGMAGCGKTQKAKALYDSFEEDNKKVQAMAKTNAVVAMLKDRGINNVSTLDSIIHRECTFDQNVKRVSKYDVILNDEFTMTNLNLMKVLYFAQLANPELRIYFFGDPNQISGVEDSFSKHVDYTTNPVIKEMISEYITLPYIEATARYDTITKNILTSFLKTGKLTHKFPEPQTPHLINMCYLNNTRKRVLSQLCTTGESIDFRYQNQRETYKINKDTPMIATANIKPSEDNEGVFNAEIYTIKSITTKQVTIKARDYESNEIKLTTQLFSKSFLPAYCVTVDRMQGKTIREAFTIHDADRMDRNRLYTALSRATKHEHIHIKGKVKTFYSPQKYDSFAKEMKNLKNEFQDGKIYKIIVNDKVVYIGSTTQSLEDRLKEHLNDPYSAVYQFAHEKPTIKLVINYACNSLRNLEKIEKKYIAKYTRENLVNRKLLPKENKAEDKAVETKIKRVEPQVLQITNGYRYRFVLNGKTYEYKCKITKKTNDEQAKKKVEEHLKKTLAEIFE